MTNCELCRQGDPSVTVRCWKCEYIFHLHKRQLDMVEEGTIIMGDCPRCFAVNCWVKRGGLPDCSGPIIYVGQPIKDLRGKR